MSPEIARLRAALEPFARATDVINISYRVTEAHLAEAKAALSEGAVMSVDGECKCVLATDKNTIGVRKGYELGGYVKERCSACAARGCGLPCGYDCNGACFENPVDALLNAARLAMEGIEVLDLLIASIGKHGNYSVESTIGFLNQARCAKLRLSEAIAKASPPHEPNEYQRSDAK